MFATKFWLWNEASNIKKMVLISHRTNVKETKEELGICRVFTRLILMNILRLTRMLASLVLKNSTNSVSTFMRRIMTDDEISV